VSKRAARRPPHLEPAATPRAGVAPEPRPRNQRALVVKARLGGRHDRLGRTEVVAIMRRVIEGDPAALLGLDRFTDVDLPELSAAANRVWGWDTNQAAVSIDPDRLLGGVRDGRARILDVARRGGRVLVASSRPASLLALHQSMARLARSAGAHLLGETEAGPLPAAGRASVRLWWVGGVAVVTDGDSLLADRGIEAVGELLFTVPRPDLVIGDRGFAGGALAAGIEVVAVADVDAVALGLAACRGQPVTVIPMHERRPAAAYAVLDPILTTPAPEAS
jgi:hypothetical protein